MNHNSTYTVILPQSTLIARLIEVLNLDAEDTDERLVLELTQTLIDLGINTVNRPIREESVGDTDRVTEEEWLERCSSIIVDLDTSVEEIASGIPDMTNDMVLAELVAVIKHAPFELLDLMVYYDVYSKDYMVVKANTYRIILEIT